MNKKIVQLEGLNQAQKEAVVQTEGPLLIIAGAGTGKTHVITSRILHLLLDKNVPASQILALTFTEKAANEMLERIDQALPLSYEEITIKTFHGFCEQILRERGFEIGIDPSYKLFNQTDQWLFFKRNLFEFELDYFRPLGNPNKFLWVLLNHFSRLKDEDISPEAYLDYAEKLQAGAQTEEQREEAKKALEIAKTYAKYQHLMAKKSALDFGDLQYYALRLFSQRSSVLAHYQERYRYILVDEFQDTNFAQYKLINLLAQKYRNLTVVGDDDQSIYKWRGASLSNIMNFEKSFPEAKKIVLTENYRSTQNILDLSHCVIQHNNPGRLEVQENINKKLQAQPETNETSADIEIWHFANFLQEAQQIAKEIINILEKQKDRLSYQDFAILVRTNRLVEPFARELLEKNIPFVIRNSQSLLSFEVIKDLYALIRFIHNPYDDIAFFRLLSLKIFGLQMGDILETLKEARTAGYEPVFKYLRKSTNEPQEQLPGFEEEKTALFDKVYALFDHLLNYSRDHSISQILREFFEQSGYLKALTQQENDENQEKIKHLAHFSEIVKSFELEQMEHSVAAFLEYLELMEQAEISLEALEAEESDAVSILTFHSAKGLEFDTVFMPSLVAQRFPAINRRDPLEVPTELIAEALPSTDQHLQEERRLFYVGCTRAKRALILSYSDAYEGRKKWKPSVFIEEAKQSGLTKEIDFRTADMPQTFRSLAREEIPEVPTKPQTLLPVVNVNRLSYSQIDTFQTCPLKYKFRYLFKIPSPSPHAANFGSSVHNTLNEFYQQLQKGTTATLELLHELYEKNWIPSGYDNKGHELARKKKGLEILERFFEQEKRSGLIIPVYLERSFHLKIGTLAFTGRIDRIDKLADGTYEVIDYKTGSSKRKSDLKKDLQLSLYALACQEVFKIPVQKLSLYFLEDASKISTTRTAEDLEEVRGEFEKLAGELKTSNFEANPDDHCRYCEFRVLCDAAK
jgi:DNA helicase-2/ATP-dependent DNA helicase PcrA